MLRKYLVVFSYLTKVHVFLELGSATVIKLYTTKIYLLKIEKEVMYTIL